MTHISIFLYLSIFPSTEGKQKREIKLFILLPTSGLGTLMLPAPFARSQRALNQVRTITGVVPEIALRVSKKKLEGYVTQGAPG